MIFSFKHSGSDNITVERVKYLTVFYVVSVLMIWSYIIRDLFVHKSLVINSANFYLGVALLLIPLINLKIKDYYQITIMALIVSLLSVTLLIFEAGGVFAPGSFWLASYPITFGILLGQKGTKIGSVILIVILVMLLSLEHLGIRGSFIMNKETFETERIINLINFAVYIILNTHYFINNETKSRIKLKEKSDEVENLLRVVVHDVSTPLTVCGITLDQLIDEQKFADNRDKRIDRLAAGYKNLTSIIFQIKLMKSVKDGKVELKNELLNVDKMIKNTLLILEAIADKKNVKLSYKCSDENLKMLGEEVSFCNIVLMNFLTNAIKFSSKNDVVTIELLEKNKNIVITVKDAGVGIPESLINDLWSMNVKTSRTGTAGERGTGYGMPLAKEFAEKMKGRVEISSVTKEQDEMNHGTIINIYFPKAAA